MCAIVHSITVFWKNAIAVHCRDFSIFMYCLLRVVKQILYVILVPAVLFKTQLIIMRPFFADFKLCEIAPKFTRIMQTVLKTLTNYANFA